MQDREISPRSTGTTVRRQQPKRVGLPNLPPLSDEYMTEKIELVAFLMCQGHMVLRYRRAGPRVQFYFAGQLECGALTDEYMIGQGQVIARTYADNLNWARAALHQV